MYRIVFYLDNPSSRCAYLRETTVDFQSTEIAPFVVCAKEYDESGTCTRTWFLSMHQAHDGENAGAHDAPPPHRIVDPHIEAGVESKQANPMARGGSGLEAVLHTLKQHQIKDARRVNQTETFCRTYNDALRRAADLEVELKTADENVRNLAERNSSLGAELAQVKAELAAKSLPQKVRAWFQKNG